MHGQGWKNVNLNLVAKNDQCREKSKHRSIVGYGVVTYHFSSITPYTKEDLGQKKFMEDVATLDLGSRPRQRLART